MACKCAKFDPDSGRYECEISGSGCMYMFPNSKQCAEDYGEGPDADKGEVMSKGKVESVYIQENEIFRCGDIVTVKQFQQKPFSGRISNIDYNKIRVDTSITFDARSRDVDLNSDALIRIERVEGEAE